MCVHLHPYVRSSPSALRGYAGGDEAGAAAPTANGHISCLLLCVGGGGGGGGGGAWPLSRLVKPF